MISKNDVLLKSERFWFSFWASPSCSHWEPWLSVHVNRGKPPDSFPGLKVTHFSPQAFQVLFRTSLSSLGTPCFLCNGIWTHVLLPANSGCCGRVTPSLGAPWPVTQLFWGRLYARFLVHSEYSVLSQDLEMPQAWEASSSVISLWMIPETFWNCRMVRTVPACVKRQTCVWRNWWSGVLLRRRKRLFLE